MEKRGKRWRAESPQGPHLLAGPKDSLVTVIMVIIIIVIIMVIIIILTMIMNLIAGMIGQIYISIA